MGGWLVSRSRSPKSDLILAPAVLQECLDFRQVVQPHGLRDLVWESSCLLGCKLMSVSLSESWLASPPVVLAILLKAQAPVDAGTE